MEKQQEYPAMQIKAAPYKHQREAYELACRLFHLKEGVDYSDNGLCDLRQADSAESKPNKQHLL